MASARSRAADHAHPADFSTGRDGLLAQDAVAEASADPDATLKSCGPVS
jgi:hypothetical protein